MFGSLVAISVSVISLLLFGRCFAYQGPGFGPFRAEQVGWTAAVVNITVIVMAVALLVR